MSPLSKVAAGLSLVATASLIPAAASARTGACDEAVEVAIDGQEQIATLVAEVIRIDGVFGSVRFPILDLDVSGVYELEDGRRIRIACGDERRD